MEPPKRRSKKKIELNIEEYFCIKDIKDCSQCLINKICKNKNRP